MQHWIPYNSEYGTGGHYADDSYFYDRGWLPPSVARLESGETNPFYDQQTYDPQGYAEAVRYAETQAGSRRGGLFGALDRVGKVFEDNVTQRLEPFVQNVADEIGPAVMKYGVPLAAAAITGGAGAELFPGFMASLSAPNSVTGLGELGINTALPAGAQGGIAAGTTLAGGALPAAAAAGGSNFLANAAGALTGAGGMSNLLGPALGAASQIAGGYMANEQISKAADTAAASADKNLAFQREMFNTIRADQEPFRAAGVSALGKLTPLMDYKKFSMSDFMADPGYQFRLTQGQQALDRSAAARAGLQSGAALKAATAFGQEMGSQEFNNAFNRYGIERERAINPLLSMAGFGQTATNNLQQGAQNFGNTAGTIMGNAGNTQANAQLARGSVYADTGNELMKMLTRYKV